MNYLHIHWTPPRQPATRFYVDDPRPGHRRHLIRRSGHKLAWCYSCGRRRRLRNLDVTEQAYYDPMYFCHGGCKPKPRRKRR
jgi:hypothetical protein